MTNFEDFNVFSKKIKVYKIAFTSIGQISLDLDYGKKSTTLFYKP
jgi:hypothetical protein